MDHFPDDRNSFPSSTSNTQWDDSNWVDAGDENKDDLKPQLPKSQPKPSKQLSPKTIKTLVMVETAFLASTGSLIWLINYYFPLEPVLRIFFPLPIALAYLRWGSRTAWMTALVTGLLLSVLMGPTRSIVFLVPYGLMGVQLGFCWRRGAAWEFSILTGALLGAFGLLFRFWLFSALLGEDLWLYVISQATRLADWIFVKLGLLARPDIFLVQGFAIGIILLNSLLYLFAVHLVALLILDRLGNSIPRPPKWVQTIIDYE